MINNTIVTEKKLTKKELRSVYLRHYQLLASYNYERQQSSAYAYAMIPAIDKLYGDDAEARREALLRHVTFFNTTCAMGPFIMGVSCAMEEQNANDTTGTFDPASINSVKASLMGPLAGIGDGFFWGTFRVIGAGVGAPLAVAGNIFGPIFYILMNFIPSTIVRYQGFKIGYKGGQEFLTKMAAEGSLNKLTEASKIIGLTVIGGMIASLVKVQIPLVLDFSGATVAVQEVLDSIIPNLLPLLLTLGVYSYIKKGNKSTYVMFGLILLGILGVAIGLF